MSAGVVRPVPGSIECQDPEIKAHYCHNNGACIQFPDQHYKATGAPFVPWCNCKEGWTGKKCTERFMEWDKVITSKVRLD